MKTLRLVLAPIVLAIGSQAFAATSGDLVAPKQIAMCVGCHGIPGYQASFPEIHKVPMIGGQSAKYIAAALVAYQKGDRKHPTMKGIAASLTEKDIEELSAYYEKAGQALPPVPGKGKAASPEVQALLTKGNCAACHGEGLNKPIDASYPKLGGQHPDYLYVALKSYTIDKNGNIGRNNAIMAGQAKVFTNQELKLLAKHIGGLDGSLHTIVEPRFK